MLCLGTNQTKNSALFVLELAPCLETYPPLLENVMSFAFSSDIRPKCECGEQGKILFT
jgi:hypothetical protein